MEKSSVTESTYRIHEGADLTNGIISLSEVILVDVAVDPATAQRPGSLSGYQRIHSTNHINEVSSNESNSTEVERRTSFTLLLKHAFARQNSPSVEDAKLRQMHSLSEPMSAQSMPTKVAVEGVENKADTSKPADQNDFTANEYPPKLNRMNSADLSLFGAAATDTKPAASIVQREPVVSSYVFLTRPADETKKIAAPPMPQYSPPPIP